MRNKSFRAILVLAIITIFGVSSAIAYFSDSDTRNNSLIIGENEITVEESFPHPSDPSEFEKVVTIKNTGNVSCYIRALVEFDQGDIGNLYEMDINTTDWTEKQSDGYYYYKKEVAPGETTIPLMTTVKQVKEGTVESDFSINVKSDSIQSKGFTDYKSAWNAWKEN